MKKTILFSGLISFFSMVSFQLKADVFKKSIADFEAVNLKLPANVVWTDSDSPTFVMECKPETEQKIEVLSEGNTLVIKAKEKTVYWDTWKGEKITIKLSSKKLSRIHINGSGDFEMKSTGKTENFEYKINGSGDLKALVQAARCSGTINGSGDVSISGKANSFDLDINGSGDVKATDFECESVEIDIAGSGDAKVWATESLNVKIAGSGDVSYKGNPKNLRQKVAGSGDLIKL